MCNEIGAQLCTVEEIQNLNQGTETARDPWTSTLARVINGGSRIFNTARFKRSNSEFIRQARKASKRSKGLACCADKKDDETPQCKSCPIDAVVDSTLEGSGIQS